QLGQEKLMGGRWRWLAGAKGELQTAQVIEGRDSSWEGRSMRRPQPGQMTVGIIHPRRMPQEEQVRRSSCMKRSGIQQIGNVKHPNNRMRNTAHPTWLISLRTTGRPL